MEIYSKQHDSQTVRARELKFGENVHPRTCVTSQVSHTTCHVSHVTCHMSHVICHIFFGQNDWGSQWRVCYQWGLPSLVLSIVTALQPWVMVVKEFSSLQLWLTVTERLILWKFSKNLHFFKNIPKNRVQNAIFMGKILFNKIKIRN